MSRSKVVRALLIGGPMYDPLYERLPEFEAQMGLKVDVIAQLPHPELRATIKEEFSAARPDIDFISTHTKYAPALAEWLAPLDKIVPGETLADLLPRAAELARVDGKLLTIPRALDFKLLYYRKDLFENPQSQDAYQKLFRRPLRVPVSWDELLDVATFLTRPGMHGFLFPGRDEGLFGTFYEMLVSAGGELFTPELEPVFDAPAGVWAADRLTEIHFRRRITPSDLTRWHYDEVSAAFRHGMAAMVCDWPGSHYLYMDPESSKVAGNTGVAALPIGFTGRRAAYAGCHSFAIPRKAKNKEGAAALLRFFTSEESQVAEGRRGSVPVRSSAFDTVRREVSTDPEDALRWDLLAQTMAEALIIPPRFAAYPPCEDALWQSLQKAITGMLPPLAAVREAADMVRLIVRKSARKKGRSKAKRS